MTRRDRPTREGGFVLLESIVSITLITVVMTAVAMLFVTVIHIDNQQRGRQLAAQLASTTLGSVRSLPASDLVTGRSVAAVAAQWASAPSAVQPYLSSMQQATDTSANAPVVPATGTPKLMNNATYTVNVYLGWCYVTDGGIGPNACVPTVQTGGYKYMRAVVGVTWYDKNCPPKSGADPTPTCVFVTSTLISTADNPIFNLNQVPPPVPIISTPPAQTAFAVGDTVNLQLGVVAGTGVPTFTWLVSTGALPPGLAMNTAGLISGVITSQVTTSVTVQVTDAFARTATGTFSWIVLPALTGSNPGPQASITGSAITPLTITPSGGSGAPYTWSDPSGTLPPGLTLATVSNNAVITGTPTRPQAAPYGVTLTVTDSTTTRKALVSFLWTISYPPLAASNPGTQTDTVNRALAGLQLAASGGDGTYRWTATGLPTGLDISTSGLVTGTPTGTTTATVTATVTDGQNWTKTVSWTWKIVAPATITAPAPAITSVGAPVSLPVTYTCPNTPCTFTLNGNQPTGLTITSAGVITGTVGGTARTYTGIVATVTDNDGVAVNSTSFSWTVVAGPSVTAPSSVIDTVGAAVSDPLSVTCPIGSCTYRLNNGPSALSITTGGVVTGTITSGAGTTFPNTTITVTDSAGSAMTTGTFTWAIVGAPTVTSPLIAPVTTVSSDVGSPVSILLASTCPNRPCSYALSGGPTGVSIDGTGRMTGTVGGAATTYPSARLTITDNDGIAATSATFAWTVAAASYISGTWPVNTVRSATPEQPFWYNCPATVTSSTCAISVSGKPSGIGISKTSGIVTTNNTTSVTVNRGTTGIVYLNGQVAGNATRTTYTVRVTITMNGSSPSSANDQGNWVVS